jgi:hypothetical protein
MRFIPLKGTVPPDFSPLFFFLQTTSPGPSRQPSDDFNFFRIFAEIFDFSGDTGEANDFIIVG